MAGPKKRRRRVVRLRPEQRAILECQRERFREKFGREPGPGDPIFFDSTADEPRPFDPDAFVATVAAAMEAAGLHPAKIHAYRRTGMLITRDNLDQWSDEDLAEWQAALDEYAALARRRN